MKKGLKELKEREKQILGYNYSFTINLDQADLNKA